jgi:hypothetical protein
MIMDVNLSPLRLASSVWFWRSDMEYWRGDQVLSRVADEPFCENAGQTNFADVSAILPYDSILVRRNQNGVKVGHKS